MESDAASDRPRSRNKTPAKRNTRAVQDSESESSSDSDSAQNVRFDCLSIRIGCFNLVFDRFVWHRTGLEMMMTRTLCRRSTKRLMLLYMLNHCVHVSASVCECPCVWMRNPVDIQPINLVLDLGEPGRQDVHAIIPKSDGLRPQHMSHVQCAVQVREDLACACRCAFLRT